MQQAETELGKSISKNTPGKKEKEKQKEKERPHSPKTSEYCSAFFHIFGCKVGNMIK